MKKFYHFCAALLVGGATLSLSSCIDTTEPAGIEAMRTSKAEWLKAKAAYENAEVQLKLVQVEREKILLELDRIDLELAKLQSETEKEKLLLAREQMLLDMNAMIAEAEKNYLQAVTDLRIAMLTYKDEKMQAKLAEYEGQLSGYNSELSGKRVDLSRALINKWLYTANKEMFVKELPVEQAKKEKDIELQKSYIAKLQELDGVGAGDLTALYEQLQAYDDELEALNEKEAKMLDEIAEMKMMDPKVAEEIAAKDIQIRRYENDIQDVNKRINAKYEEYNVEHPITIAKKAVSESMVDVSALAQALSWFDGEAFDAAFEYDYDLYAYVMVGDYVLNVELLDYEYQANRIIARLNDNYVSEELCKKVEYQANQAKNKISAIENAIKAMNGEIAALNDNIQALEDEIDELQATQYDVEAVWAKEYECYLINGNWNCSYNNPYYMAFQSGYYDVVTERSIVLDAKELVQDAIDDAEGGFTYWYYNPVEERMEQVVSGSLSRKIEAEEKVLANLEKELDKLNAVIAAVAEYDVKAGSWEEFFAGSFETSQYLDEQIAGYEAAIARLEVRVDVVEAAIAALIAAYEAGELDVTFPEADEPTDEPADEPEADEPADEPAEDEAENGEGEA